MKTEILHTELSALGDRTDYGYTQPDRKVLETFPVPEPDRGELAAVEIEAKEFTSLCPRTGQPDHGAFIITYKPRAVCLESKSLKLYLGMYRMHGSFAETITAKIGEDLVAVLDPRWLQVKGIFVSRGGISFNPVFAYTGAPTKLPSVGE